MEGSNSFTKGKDVLDEDFKALFLDHLLLLQ